MSTYKINLQWRMVRNLDHITEIISITWVESLHGYTVTWKVREWEGNSDAI